MRVGRNLEARGRGLEPESIGGPSEGQVAPTDVRPWHGLDGVSGARMTTAGLVGPLEKIDPSHEIPGATLVDAEDDRKRTGRCTPRVCRVGLPTQREGLSRSCSRQMMIQAPPTRWRVTVRPEAAARGMGGSTGMSTRVAINGLGRIGRATLKLGIDEPSLAAIRVLPSLISISPRSWMVTWSR